MADSSPDEPINSGSGDLAEYFKDLFAWLRGKLGIDLNEALKGSDWMLVVMLHAMIETALNAALVLELREPRLEKIISKLDTSDGSRGKVAFAKALGMLEKPSVDFLQALSTLRNFCVHNIRNFQFDIFRHLAEHENAEDLRKALRKGMLVNARPGTENSIIALADGSPRLALFAGSFNIMTQLHLHNEKCIGREATEELYRLKAARLDEIEPHQSTATE
jgi:hypothetical protein